jgi:hypothetical protein
MDAGDAVPVIADFLKRLYKRRQQTDDPVLRRGYQIAEKARTDLEISAVRRVFGEELSIEGQAFDVMFASYWLSLEMTGNGRDWNLELEPLMKEVGITENALMAARTHFTTAVINRMFLRVAMDRLAKTHRQDLGRADASQVKERGDRGHGAPDDAGRAKLLETAEGAITAMIEEGFRKNRGPEVIARLLAAQKELGESD